jgi:hypothetical protein
MRIATPSLQWTFTTYSLPVSTGAPVCKIFATALTNIIVIKVEIDPAACRRWSLPEDQS